MSALFFNQSAHIGALEFASSVIRGKQYNTQNDDFERSISNDAVQIIVSVVCNFLEVPYSNVMMRTRRRPIVFARQCIGYFLKNHTNLSLNQIAPHMGITHHATVIHSVELIDDLCSYDASISRQIRRMRHEIEEQINALNENRYA